MPSTPKSDRRRRPRTSRENRTTGLIQAALRNPRDAARMLEKDLADGADPVVVFSLLDAAASALQARGADDKGALEAVRERLRRRARHPAPVRRAD